MIQKIVFTAVAVLTIQMGALAQKIQVAQIKTSAECGTCKKTIESKMNYTKGVVYAELNVDTKLLEIKYNTKKTTIDQLRTEVSHLGYDADQVPANPDKQVQLPPCCQPGGMGTQK